MCVWFGHPGMVIYSYIDILQGIEINFRHFKGLLGKHTGVLLG